MELSLVPLNAHSLHPSSQSRCFCGKDEVECGVLSKNIEECVCRESPARDWGAIIPGCKSLLQLLVESFSS
jgi:hypothetical protein